MKKVKVNEIIGASVGSRRYIMDDGKRLPAETFKTSWGYITISFQEMIISFDRGGSIKISGETGFQVSEEGITFWGFAHDCNNSILEGTLPL